MITKKIDIKGFTSPNGNDSFRPYVLNIALFGQEGAGKSRFIGTAPDPIGGLIYDAKSEMSLRRAQEEFGKIIVWPDQEVTNRLVYDEDLRKLNKMSDDDFRKHYQDRVELATNLLMELCHHKDIKTIFIDTFYQLCQEIKWSIQGRHQAHRKIKEKVIQDNEPVYAMIIKLMSRINVKHSIYTHRPKDEYINDSKTGRQTWQGFKYLGNHTNVAIELERNYRKDPDWFYRLNIRNCQPNATLQTTDGLAENTGLQDDAITFELMARAIFSDVDDEIIQEHLS